MHIAITNTQSDIAISEKAVEHIVSAVLEVTSVSCDEISIQFATKEEITVLHADYFDDPTPTDCITFPIDPPDEAGLLGEVFVCPKVAQEYVQTNGGNEEEETILYICHGILHLLGYDDILDEDRAEMKQQEAFLMDALRKKGLLTLTS